MLAFLPESLHKHPIVLVISQHFVYSESANEYGTIGNVMENECADYG